MPSALVVLCTCPDRETASRLAAMLVDEGLAACVNILGDIRSVFRWEGNREEAEEVLLIIKTGASRYTALQEKLQQQHPYEVPEIIALPVAAGLETYLEWIDQCIATKPP